MELDRLLVARMAGGFELRAAAPSRFVDEVFIELPGQSLPTIFRVDRDQMDVGSRLGLRDETHEIRCDSLVVLYDVSSIAEFVDEDGVMQLVCEITLPIGAVIGDDAVKICSGHLRDVHEKAPVRLGHFIAGFASELRAVRTCSRVPAS